MSAARAKRNSLTIEQRLANWFDAFVGSGDLTTLLITCVLLVMPALSLAAADWPIQLQITIPVTILSVIFGYGLSSSRYNELFALIVSAIYGLVFVLLIAAFNQSLNPLRGIETVLIRSIEWIFDAATGGINQDNLVFSMLVAVLFWFFGYNAAWHIFRIDRVWRVIIPPGLILLVNMVVYTGENPLDLYLLVFVMMSLLLVVRSNLDAREWDWRVNGVRVPQRLSRQFTGAGAVLALVALLAAWAIPSGALQQRLDEFQQFLASDPIQQVTEFMSRLVEPIESEGPATTDYYGGDSLNLGGAIRLGDQEILYVDAPTDYRYYWRSRVFERYVDGRWSPSATRRVPDLSPPLNIITPPGSEGGRVTVSQTVTMGIPSRLFYAAPQPLSVSLPGRIDLLRTADDQDDPNSPMNISVIRPTQVIDRGESYTALSAISIASADQLRSAGTDYPEWVANPNAYPGGISGQVAGLTQQIIAEAGATTPYDQAKAVEAWLRTNITYNETISAPPAGVDSVEWFLFTQREGYCTYYATAMVMMLRSQGIPARMAAGFAQGEYLPELGQYVIRERDAHTWVEVYFPGYGWVEFEPTSAEAPLNRDGDEVAPDDPQSIAQEPTALPTNTPTPQPSPTPEATATQQDETATDEAAAAPPTLTPSPTPTATPVIVPTVPPPVQPPEPPPQDFLSFLLPAIGAALLLIVGVIAFVLLLVLLWWWWEWRGMGGLSPIARAYARLERYFTLIGFRSGDNETPEERRGEMVRYLPQAERPVTAIARAYTVERYSPPAEGSAESEQNAQIADNAWPEARTRIIRRWLRRFVPWLRS